LEHSEVKAIYNKYIREKNLRDTKQREFIIEEFLSSKKHITVEELHGQLEKRTGNIGIATIYRTLKVMCECGLANEIKLGREKARYEQSFGYEHHDHLICEKCGKFIEAKDERIEKLQKELVKKYGFSPRAHKLEIYGLCSACKQKRRKDG